MGTGAVDRAFLKVEPDANERVQEVVGILEIKTYLVNFRDGEGKEGNRVVFQPDGSDEVFNLQEMIAGRHVAARASRWFRESFNKKLNMSKDVESV